MSEFASLQTIFAGKCETRKELEERRQQDTLLLSSLWWCSIVQANWFGNVLLGKMAQADSRVFSEIMLTSEFFNVSSDITKVLVILYSRQWFRVEQLVLTVIVHHVHVHHCWRKLVSRVKGKVPPPPPNMGPYFEKGQVWKQIFPRISDHTLYKGTFWTFWINYQLRCSIFLSHKYLLCCEMDPFWSADLTTKNHIPPVQVPWEHQTTINYSNLECF